MSLWLLRHSLGLLQEVGWRIPRYAQSGIDLSVDDVTNLRQVLDEVVVSIGITLAMSSHTDDREVGV